MTPPVAQAVLSALHSPHSRRRYAAVYDDFFAAPGLELTARDVQAYIAEWRDNGAAPATVNLKLSALKALAKVAADPGELAAIEAIKGMPVRGVRMGTWLSVEQVGRLVDIPGAGLAAARNRAIMAVLVGSAVRRAELVSLDCSHLQTIGGRLCILNLVGKGRRVRTVPLPPWAEERLRAWLEAGQIAAGKVWRRVYGGRVAEEGISSDHIHTLVREQGARIGVPSLAPHDLRRTFANLARAGKADLEQIQLTLGHESLRTTERYLGGRLNLEEPACDAIRL